MQEVGLEAQAKLEKAQNIWLASIRTNGSAKLHRPHLVPIWFAWYAGKVFICIESSSVKGRNMASNPQVVLALEDGLNPVICEGKAAPLARPWPQAVIEIFQRKYAWDISTETQYNLLVEITPEKWLVW